MRNDCTTEPLADFLTKGTWYEVGLGACGYDDTDSESIVAISAQIYGSGGYCNQVGHCTPPPCKY
jgi:hypothetical protein